MYLDSTSSVGLGFLPRGKMPGEAKCCVALPIFYVFTALTFCFKMQILFMGGNGMADMVVLISLNFTRA